MKPKKIIEAEREIEKSQKKESKVNRAIFAYQDEQKEAESKLIELQNQLPLLLAAHAIGELSDAGLAKKRKEIQELKRKVIEIPLTIKGLKKLSYQLPVKQQLAKRTIGYFEKYEDLKERIRESYDSILAEQLVEIGREIDQMEDAEKFLLEQVEVA